MARCRFTLVFVIVMLFALTSFVSALPSFRGYTGLMIIPTADALNDGQWNVGLSSEDVGDDLNNIYANYGLSDGLEVGINAQEPVDASDRDTVFNGKYRFLTETDERPAVAAGIIDLTSEEETTVYIVASKSINTPLGTYEGEIINPRVHIGFGGGEFDSIFLGISTYIGNRVQVMGEWDSEFWHAGANWRITRGLTLQAGFLEIGKGTNFGLNASFSRLF